MTSLPLLVRPQPYKGESLRGYLLRLGQENGLGGSLLKGFSRSHGPLFSLHSENLAVMLRLEADSSPKEWSAGWGIDQTASGDLGIRLPSSHTRVNVCAVCPCCLKSCRAVRGEWEISEFCACPDHKCWLIDTCPSCHRALSWIRPGPALCGCGGNLAEAPSNRAPESVVALSSLIADRYRGFVQPETLRSISGHPELGDLDLASLLRTVRLVGYLGYAGGVQLKEGAIARSTQSTFAREQAVASRAARALGRWPVGLHEALLAFPPDEERGPRAELDVIKWPNPWYRLAPSPIEVKRLGLPQFVRHEVFHERARRTYKYWGKNVMLLNGKSCAQGRKSQALLASQTRKLDVGAHRKRSVSERMISSTLGVSIDQLGDVRAAGLIDSPPGSVTLGELDKALTRWSRSVNYYTASHPRDGVLEVVSSGEMTLSEAISGILTGRLRATHERLDTYTTIANVALYR